jgi:acyl dehydratase
VMDGTVIAFTGLEWKFKNPVKIGDTIHAVGKVKQTKGMKALNGGFVIVDLRVLNQRGETTQLGEMTVLIKSKG